MVYREKQCRIHAPVCPHSMFIEVGQCDKMIKTPELQERRGVGEGNYRFTNRQLAGTSTRLHII
jgi:hypothetical protein